MCVHICALIHSHTKLAGALLGAESILGQNKSSKLRGMTQASQRDILSRFNMGKVKLLVATSVVEEGIDVQSCGMVIRYAECPTLVSVLQSRGRARQRHSIFFVFTNMFSSETCMAQIRRSVNKNEMLLF
uniref:Interferon-induced helicase C domain-containing protein 1 n=1 Tax=Lygus hesperus TaxID=30085 RepID=A0A0A9YKS2_LYGHE